MQDREQQNNEKIRQIRKKRFTLYIQQKEKFSKIFTAHLQPNFLQKQYQQLLLYGIPTPFRNYIWTQLIPNHHQITPFIYNQLIEQLKVYRAILQDTDKKMKNHEIVNKQLNPETLNQSNGKIMKWISTIKQDIPRTFPELRALYSDQQQFNKLSNVLGCFALLRSDIGYVQGLSLIASLFIQELSTQFRAFTAITTLLTTTVLYDFYTFNDSVITQMSEHIIQAIKEQQEDVYQRLNQLNIEIKMIIIEWVITLFSRCFQLDSILNLWDLLLAHHMNAKILQRVCVLIIMIRKQQIIEQQQSGNIIKLFKQTKLTISQEQNIFERMQQIQFYS